MGRLLPTMAATAVVMLLAAGSTWATFPGENGRIAWVTDIDGNWEIHSIEPDGSGRTNLTNHPATDEDPAWSADGSRIAFSSDRSGKHELYVMDADGSNVQQLSSTPTGADSREPAWSPDGTRLVYTRVLDEGPPYCTSQIWIRTLDGTEDDGVPVREVEQCPRDPEWSPDGLYRLPRERVDGGARGRALHASRWQRAREDAVEHVRGAALVAGHGLGDARRRAGGRSTLRLRYHGLA